MRLGNTTRNPSLEHNAFATVGRDDFCPQRGFLRRARRHILCQSLFSGYFLFKNAYCYVTTTRQPDTSARVHA